jgi:hypothetical protein
MVSHIHATQKSNAIPLTFCSSEKSVLRPLWGLRRNSSFHVIAMDAIFAGDEAKTRDLLAEVSDLVDQGALTALPFRSFPASRIYAAFRLMAGGKHTGKVVVGFAEPFIVMSAISRCTPIWHPCRDAMDLRLFPVVSLCSTTG